MWNKQLHNNTRFPYLSTWIINQFKNSFDVANKTKGGMHFTSKSTKKTSKPDRNHFYHKISSKKFTKTEKAFDKEDIFLYFVCIFCKFNIVKIFTFYIFVTIKTLLIYRRVKIFAMQSWLKINDLFWFNYLCQPTT